MDRALVTAKGRNRSGITIPDMMPNVLTASFEATPAAINLLGTKIEFADDIADDRRRIPVIGTAIFNILLKMWIAERVWREVIRYRGFLR